jgi:hypothetical protein
MTMTRERRERSAWPAVLFVVALFACGSWHGPGGGSDCSLGSIGGDDDSFIGDSGTFTPADGGGGDDDIDGGTFDAGGLDDSGSDVTDDPAGESPSPSALQPQI